MCTLLQACSTSWTIAAAYKATSTSNTKHLSVWKIYLPLYILYIMFFDFLSTFDVIVHKFPCFKQTHWALGFNYLHFTTKESSFAGKTCHITEQVCHTNYCQSPFHYIFNAPTRIHYITFLSQPLRTFVLPFLGLHNNSNTTVGAGMRDYPSGPLDMTYSLMYRAQSPFQPFYIAQW